MTAITNAPRVPWAHTEAPAPAAPAAPSPSAPSPSAPSPSAPSPSAQPSAEQRSPLPVAGSIEDLGRQLLEETNAARCVAYRRSRTGQLIWQHEVSADAQADAGTLGSAAGASGGASVQITRPVRDAFGQIIGVIQTRESSDPTF